MPRFCDLLFRQHPVQVGFRHLENRPHRVVESRVLVRVLGIRLHAPIIAQSKGNPMDERILLIRFLLKRLCETKTEVYVSRAVFLNFPTDVQPEILRLQKFYREEGTIRQRTEMEFQPFYELIEQFPQESAALRTLLEKWNPEGDPN